MKRRVLILASTVAMFILATTAGSALAHRAYQGWSTVWENGAGKCLNEKVSLDHVSGSTGGKFWTELQAEREYLGTDCTVGWSRPPNYLRVKVVILKLSSGTWGVCYDSGYLKNNVDADYIQRTVTAGSTPPCGNGEYRTQGYGHILYNGSWRGGSIAIPVGEAHFLPCAVGSEC